MWAEHAEQQSGGGYYPHRTQNFGELIRRMFRGEVTVATYSMGEDGLTVQCGFDIDNHKKNNAALPRLNATIDHVRQIGGQPVVVASGSPDSYHVHIPIIRSPLGASNGFVKAMHNELKHAYNDLNFKSDTEVFPKQKNNRKLHGNALKLPFALNRKSGKRAEILDPDTKEPVDVIFITKVIELREPEKAAVSVGTRKYLPAKTRSPGRKGTGMRQCILSAIKEQMEGSEGNDMRVAVVCEALAAGKTRDEVIRLFEGQDDFDFKTTAYYVDYCINKEYRPWHCDTIRDKCPSFANCEDCPIHRSRVLVEPAGVNT